jgi:uncharacterized coiled-coil DUF342 family protein
MERQVVTRARRALELLSRGALYERRTGVRVAVMADLGAAAEAVEELARLQGELGAAAEAVAAARSEAATAARTCREEVAMLRGRLELSLQEADGWRARLEATQDELAATRRCLEAAEEALSARVGA